MAERCYSAQSVSFVHPVELTPTSDIYRAAFPTATRHPASSDPPFANIVPKVASTVSPAPHTPRTSIASAGK